MMNTIEEINNPQDTNFDIDSPRNDETSGCNLVEMLEKNIAILRLEALQITKIDTELEAKLQSYNELSHSLTSKLQSLVKLSELNFGDREEIRQFVEQITLSWLNTNEQVVKDCAGIHVASRTIAGAALSPLLEKKKKETAAIKVSLQIGSVIYDPNYVSRGYKIYDEICRILESMEHCDDKIQQYMVICQTTPYLSEISTAIDAFVDNTNLSPSIATSNDSAAGVFRFVSQLLTGELFGYDPTNPRQILADNAPRKPVFITFNRALNNKRRNNVSKIKARSKISRSSSFPPAVRSGK